MTGAEFQRLVKMYGKQVDVAKTLGVEADTIRARYSEDAVPPLYEHAILGLLLKQRLPDLVQIAELACGTGGAGKGP